MDVVAEESKQTNKKHLENVEKKFDEATEKVKKLTAPVEKKASKIANKEKNEKKPVEKAKGKPSGFKAFLKKLASPFSAIIKWFKNCFKKKRAAKRAKESLIAAYTPARLNL